MAGIDAITRLTAAMTNMSGGGTTGGPTTMTASTIGAGIGDIAKSFTVPVLDGTAQAPGSFQHTLAGAINEVSSAQDRATDYTARFVRGENIELHQVMAATEEAEISAQMLVEVRNKVMDAYRSLINMQS